MTGYLSMSEANRLLTLQREVESILTGDNRVQRIVAFGSLAKGTQDAWSDIDLIVVTRDDRCFAHVFNTLRHAKPVLYHAPFEFQPEPIGSHILGIVFVDAHPFNCLDLNFLAEPDYFPATLRRFGILQERFRREQPVQSFDCEASLETQLGNTILDREIGTALHFTKKMTKKFLRGQCNREDAVSQLENLRSVVNQYSADLQLPNGKIGLLASQYLDFCTSVLWP